MIINTAETKYLIKATSGLILAYSLRERRTWQGRGGNKHEVAGEMVKETATNAGASFLLFTKSRIQPGQ